MSPLPFIVPSELLSIILVGVALCALLELVWIIMLEVRLRHFMRGEKGANLEGVIRSILARHTEFETFQKELAGVLKSIDTRIKGAARGVGVVRFDAFSGDGSGGMQSFATALLSERGDGVVISSLHARASTRIFAKPVHAFTSENELTEEEQHAINTARSQTTL
jgi:hypothetical protein